MRGERLEEQIGFRFSTTSRDEEMRALPVLMLTARGQSRDREMAEKAGVSRFMTKPFSNAEVMDAVRDLHAQASRT